MNIDAEQKPPMLRMLGAAALRQLASRRDRRMTEYQSPIAQASDVGVKRSKNIESVEIGVGVLNR